MAKEQGHNGGDVTHGHDAHHHGPRMMPAVLMAPDVVSVWQKRAATAAIVLTVVSVLRSRGPTTAGATCCART